MKHCYPYHVGQLISIDNSNTLYNIVAIKSQYPSREYDDWIDCDLQEQVIQCVPTSSMQILTFEIFYFALLFSGSHVIQYL